MRRQFDPYAGNAVGAAFDLEEAELLDLTGKDTGPAASLPVVFAGIAVRGGGHLGKSDALSRQQVVNSPF